MLGEWTSGKSSGSEPVIRRFESYLPSHFQLIGLISKYSDIVSI